MGATDPDAARDPTRRPFPPLYTSFVRERKCAISLARTVEPPKPPSVQGVVASDGATTLYGTPQERDGVEYIQLAKLSLLGEAQVDAAAPLRRCSHTRFRRLLRWDGAIVGIAESTYPHPKGWTLADLPTPVPLDKTRTRHLTAACRRGLTCEPSCQALWEARLDSGELPWHLIYALFASPLLTNPDQKNASRIVNRSLYSRTWENKHLSLIHI